MPPISPLTSESVPTLPPTASPRPPACAGAPNTSPAPPPSSMPDRSVPPASPGIPAPAPCAPDIRAPAPPRRRCPAAARRRPQITRPLEIARCMPTRASSPRTISNNSTARDSRISLISFRGASRASRPLPPLFGISTTLFSGVPSATALPNSSFTTAAASIGMRSACARSREK